MAIITITQPAAPAVSIAECKAQCRVDHADEDTWFELAAFAATAAAEHITGRRFITQTVEAIYDAFPASAIKLGVLPVQSVTSIAYRDSAGAEITIASNAYVLDGLGLMSWVLPAAGYAWPAAADAVNTVRVRFVAGYGATSADVPAVAKQWMLMHVATAYRQRESIGVAVSMSELPNRYVGGLLDSLMLWDV